MGRWALLLLTAVAAWAAAPSASLFPSDEYLLPAGALELVSDADPANGISLFAQPGAVGFVAAAEFAQGVCMRFESTRDLVRGGPIPWLPADVDWRAALAPDWNQRAAEDLMVRAARRLWPDWDQPVTCRQTDQLVTPSGIETAMFDLTTEPQPGLEVEAGVVLWPWGRRILWMKRSQPIIPAGWRPKVTRDEAVRLARRQFAGSAPAVSRGAVAARVGARAGSTIEAAPVWQVTLCDAEDVTTGVRAGAPTAGVTVDANTGRVVEVHSPEELARELGGLSLTRALLSAGRRAPKAGPGARWPSWSSSGVTFVAQRPGRSYPWWRPDDEVVYVARPDGAVGWLGPGLGSSGRFVEAGIAQDWVWAVGLLSGLYVCTLADGQTASASEVLSAGGLGPRQVATTVYEADGSGYAVQLRDLRHPERVERRLAVHGRMPGRLCGDATGRWLAYGVGEQLVIADAQMRQPMRHVAFATGSSAKPAAWVSLGSRALCLVLEDRAGGYVPWLVDPADGGRSWQPLPAALTTGSHRIRGQAPDGGVLVQTAAGLFNWRPLSGTVTPFNLPAWRDAGALTFANGRDALDLACAANATAYAKLRSPEPLADADGELPAQ